MLLVPNHHVIVPKPIDLYYKMNYISSTSPIDSSRQSTEFDVDMYGETVLSLPTKPVSQYFVELYLDGVRILNPKYPTEKTLGIPFEEYNVIADKIIFNNPITGNLKVIMDSTAVTSTGGVKILVENIQSMEVYTERFNPARVAPGWDAREGATGANEPHGEGVIVSNSAVITTGNLSSITSTAGTLAPGIIISPITSIPNPAAIGQTVITSVTISNAIGSLGSLYIYGNSGYVASIIGRPIITSPQTISVSFISSDNNYRPISTGKGWYSTIVGVLTPGTGYNYARSGQAILVNPLVPTKYVNTQLRVRVGDSLYCEPIVLSQPENGYARLSRDRKSMVYVPNPDYVGYDSFSYTLMSQHGQIGMPKCVFIEVVQAM